MQVVVELSTFLRAAEREGVSEENRASIVDMIANDPSVGAVIQGTGGSRKVRVAGRGFGKSGGYRIITFFSGPTIPAFLITIYGKGTRDNLTDMECQQLRGLAAELVETYARRAPPSGRGR